MNSKRKHEQLSLLVLLNMLPTYIPSDWIAMKSFMPEYLESIDFTALFMQKRKKKKTPTNTFAAFGVN